MFSKLTISARIMTGYIIFFVIFLSVVITAIIQSISSSHQADTLDVYNKVDIEINETLTHFLNSRISVREMRLTKTYGDNTYNTALNELAETKSHIDVFSASVQDYSIDELKGVANEVDSEIEKYKASIIALYDLDRQKIETQETLLATADELGKIFNETAHTINDNARAEANAGASPAQISKALNLQRDFTDLIAEFGIVNSAVKNILLLDNVSNYDLVKEYLHSIKTSLTGYESILTASSSEAYGQLISHLNLYGQYLDDYKAFILKSGEYSANLDASSDLIQLSVEKANDITLPNLNGAVSNILGTSHTSLRTIIIVVILGGTLNSISVSLISKSINKVLLKSVSDLAESIAGVTDASGQLTIAANSLAQSTSEQAASIEETSATMNETTSMINQNNQITHNAVNLSKVSEKSASHGVEKVEKLADFMGKLNQSSDEINKIVSSINTIALQTNILALNASVEAVHAGEAGRSFSVVAEEVQNLAQQTAAAAESTTNIINDNISLSKLGLENSKEVEVSLKAICDDTEKVSHLLSEISNASEEQTRGVQQINNAMAQMEKTTQSTSAISEESAAAANELQNQAVTLQSIMQRMKILVGKA